MLVGTIIHKYPSAHKLSEITLYGHFNLSHPLHQFSSIESGRFLLRMGSLFCYNLNVFVFKLLFIYDFIRTSL